MCAPQVEDSSKLEYQAGQEEEEGGGKDKDKRKPEPQQQQQQEADKDRQGGEGEEEGGVNEDVEDKYEESHFAPPTAPEQVILVHTLKEATVIMARANHDKIHVLQRSVFLYFKDLLDLKGRIS